MVKVGLSLSALGLGAARFALRALAVKLFVYVVALRLIVARRFLVEYYFFVVEQLSVFFIIIVAL